MKKKLLSLVLAGAMVASTSVSAFAADKLIDSSDNSEPTTNVTITGEVLSDNGTRPEGKFNVTIPTAASFTVNQTGDLQGTTIKVSNKGTQDIDVYAEKFIDTKNGTGISVVSETQLSSLPRTSVSLTLEGNLNTLYLKSESDGVNAGLYTDSDLLVKATESSGKLKLANVKAQQEVPLTLSGKAGSDDSTEIGQGVSNDFTLMLKIKKSPKQ